MDRPIRGRRVARCPECRLPSALCICDDVPRLTVRTRVVLFAHRREAISSTNTGRLAARALDRAELRVLGRLRQGPSSPLPAGRKLVLFPRADARVLCPDDAVGEPVVLLVPDGTWSQARRMLTRDPDLAEAELVTLPRAAESTYRLRRHPRDGALCTLEAVARAMGILEGPAVEEALNAVLARFVERAMSARTGIAPGRSATMPP